ncbi:serine/threonine-protein kinase [Haliangium ochraceum]|uniref:Serine/threonine protein kinase n=1 Tax=Haliangium ochraceum (strain DSM 14365 / JCM 11303 / SMP-2) TaxID=502025 RepID=D0LHC8_HALO1|nr:serine/threonine-protein kinase [Haliangium ochraceum]ACY18273.1 serine/threonine protein kinase [Haliangium ochraceum DSM 14365]
MRNDKPRSGNTCPACYAPVIPPLRQCRFCKADVFAGSPEPQVQRKVPSPVSDENPTNPTTNLSAPQAVDTMLYRNIADRYVIESRIGQGGMGFVYRARHLRLGRTFAVKVLRHSFETNSKMRSRFIHEAEIIGGLYHPNLVSVVDFGESDEGFLYLVMDYIDGRSLAEIIEDQGALDRERIIQIMKQLCEGLAYAHEQGLIHRDFKPSNILLSDRGGVEHAHIVDFGLALTLESLADSRMTTAGFVLGTPRYMAPEQSAEGGEIDHRVDLFSLGLVLYEMLAGVPPFEGSAVDVARKNLSSDPPQISRRKPNLEVDPGLEAIAFRLLAKNPDQRYQNAKEVLAELKLLEDNKEPLAAKLNGEKPHSSMLPLAAKYDVDATTRGVTRGAREEPKSRKRTWALLASAALALAVLLTLCGPPPFGDRVGEGDRSAALGGDGDNVSMSAGAGVGDERAVAVLQPTEDDAYWAHVLGNGNGNGNGNDATARASGDAADGATPGWHGSRTAWMGGVHAGDGTGAAHDDARGGYGSDYGSGIGSRDGNSAARSASAGRGTSGSASGRGGDDSEDAVATAGERDARNDDASRMAAGGGDGDDDGTAGDGSASDEGERDRRRDDSARGDRMYTSNAGVGTRRSLSTARMELGPLYRLVGNRLDVLVARDGEPSAEWLLERYFSIPIADALRTPSLHREVRELLEVLYVEVEKRLRT